MRAEQIHAKIYAGRGKAALRLGVSYDVWRPAQAADPFTNQIATIKAAFNSGDNTYKMPNMPGEAYWFADIDGRLTKAGDYLTHAEDPTNIKFIAGQQLLLPIVAVDCNRSVRLSRPVAPSGAAAVGAMGYSGLCDSAAESVDMLGTSEKVTGGKMIGWPCSILVGKGSLKNSAALPAGTRNQMGWLILLPPSIPIVVNVGDRITDDLGRLYVVDQAEQTDLGWRIYATEVHA
jgi:hypothetical protein